MIKVTVDNGKEVKTFEGKFAVVGTIKDVGENEEARVAAFGNATAFGATYLGCRIVSQLVEPFDTLKKVSNDDYE